jgi:homoserine dehydrogenase
MAPDRPGVLGSIASVLGRHGLSIASVIQKDRGTARTVPVIMRTHEAPGRSLKRALEQIRKQKIVQAAPAFIRIEEKL